MGAIGRGIVCGLFVVAAAVVVGSPAHGASVEQLRQRREAGQQPAGGRRRPAAQTAVLTASNPQPVGSTLVPALGGEVVYDPALNVTWLADANLPARQTFGISGINASGSMSFSTAQAWVAAMNKYNHGAGYLDRHDWQLPTAPHLDSSCGSKNKNNFGFGCRNSAMGSLYYAGLRLHDPNTAVPMPPSKTGPFSNFQPYLYWTGRRNINHPRNAGTETFSFANGFLGANVDKNYLYALPMIKGKLPGMPAATGRGLQANPGGQTVYDPVADVTWLADANLAASRTFGVQGVNRDGSMTETTAAAWIQAMNDSAYLQQRHWTLPPVPSTDPSCNMKGSFGFGCTGNPLGELYYNQLKLRQGTPVVPTPDVAVGPFHHLQPYLYWGCEAASAQMPCGATPPAANFEWSFSFGNGFEGTDVDANELYVMVYHPGSAIAPPNPHPLPPSGKGVVALPCRRKKCQ